MIYCYYTSEIFKKSKSEENSVMTKQVSVVLVGIGGYGNMYLRALLDPQNVNAYVEGVVDVVPENSNYYQEII